MSNKMKRITDLFTQGDVCYLGDDEEGKPVCVWVQKNSSLHEDEARMDGQSARTQLLLALSDVTHPEIQNVSMSMSEWDDEALHNAVLNQKYEDHIAGALADIEADKEWTDKLEYLRRQPTLLDDAQASDDDPRRVQWDTYNTEYLVAVQKLAEDRKAATLLELQDKDRGDVEADFLDEYKKRLGVEHYMLEAKITKLYFACRDCDATKKENGEWDHKHCDHGKLLMPNRAEVRELPEDVLAKIIDTFEGLAVGGRNVGNFPPAPSS